MCAIVTIPGPTHRFISILFVSQAHGIRVGTRSERWRLFSSDEIARNQRYINRQHICLQISLAFRLKKTENRVLLEKESCSQSALVHHDQICRYLRERFRSSCLRWRRRYAWPRKRQGIWLLCYLFSFVCLFCHDWLCSCCSVSLCTRHGLLFFYFKEIFFIVRVYRWSFYSL